MSFFELTLIQCLRLDKYRPFSKHSHVGVIHLSCNSAIYQTLLYHYFSSSVSQMRLSLSITTVLPLAQALIYPQHYPPADSPITNLDKVFSPAQGTNGGIYSLEQENDNYGAYNFCNMPHVRKSEYKVPDGYKLEYVEVIHRHHKRTPYASNVFPKEDIPLLCDGVIDFFYGQVKSENSSALVGWNSYVDPQNPFAAQYGFNGSCQFPQLSQGGLEDSFQHGKDLYENYHSYIGFLPESYDSEKVKFFATNNVITSQVAGALISGMFRDLDGINVEVSVQRPASDYLEPKYSCSGADQVKKYILASDPWEEHLERSKGLFSELDAISGVNPDDRGWHVSWDHYFDNLAHRKCHGLPLPCKIGEPEKCISEEQAEQVFRLGDYEYSFQHRLASQLTYYLVARYGVFLQKLQQHLQEAMAHSSKVIYRHNVAHDGSVAPLLGALQIEELRWPGMGAEVVFELWSRGNDYFIRALYGGQALKTLTELGVLDMVPVEKFFDYLDLFLKDNNVYELCQ